MISFRATRTSLSVAAALGLTSALIRTLGLRRAARVAWWVADRMPAPRPSPLAPAEIAAGWAHTIARVADDMPVVPRCLPRALLLALLLRRRGIGADLCLGARIGADFDAHAWIEIDGAPVNEAADLESAYRRLWRLPTVAR
ncbi:MAG TPA: lasso peptide biosynthesis B2 protein [Sphingopyxis sp.]|nr:lasso peptide biosynthesis B2 protein [Sphingopyxis sp.]HMP45668.1 lasso peptide biosynthesis B2 protein [Sphingopyxis sp.]HMQ17904.1 lasso peptide biosynthesis B2 protein [Sphingopyxis sp.]